MWRFISCSFIIWLLITTQSDCKKCKNNNCQYLKFRKSLDQLFDELNNYKIDGNCKVSETCAISWMNFYNKAFSKIYEGVSYLEYEFSTNMNEENQKRVIEVDAFLNRFILIARDKSLEYNISESWDESLKRQFKFARLASLTEIIIPNQEEKIEFSSLSKKLEYIYATAKVCDNSTNECLALEPEITEIMTNSRDYDKLLWVWKGWHDATGPKMRDIYTRTVEIRNKAARENGYKDLSEKWMEDFEDDNFEKNYDDLFEQIRPLYEQLHAYVRRKLKNVYGSKYPPTLNPKLIPAHLLGNMWAQSWENIYELVTPYPDVRAFNLSQNLLEQNYTVEKMFKLSEEFFTSIGLYKMTHSFWKNSMLTKPKDREVQCHASAHDFYNGYDFRIKMCTTITAENFFIAHHEMGHIEYYMAYKDQPFIFKTGANSAFHEAIGDTIALSVQTTKHLRAINLIDFESMSKEQEINFLMMMALNKVAFLPFGYLVDKWRWDLFRDKFNSSNYNQKWWEMIKQFQGIESPIERNEDYFDPAAKFHIASNVPYARYFLSFILQFQFYESLCKLSKHEGPLYNCDFYASKSAGEKFKEMLKLGASKHWSYTLKMLTGETVVSASSLLEYFKPLYEWLIEENSKYPNDKVGF
ncbi:unnamed protein product [Brachionus calyciflorus]|uniref:Angiotensin-converting enzyme n=1 Tax=Brachionus calyciflorus TaxID=104777 RepID=A0A813NZ33_9BILA|nr:unnamed protein product [Brachionus calyciflorus]